MTGAELKRLRVAGGLTQEEVADRVGVHRTTVNHWERVLGGELEIPDAHVRLVRLNVDPAYRRCGCCGGEGYVAETAPAPPVDHGGEPGAS